jgi:hypothetical protein
MVIDVASTIGKLSRFGQELLQLTIATSLRSDVSDGRTAMLTTTTTTTTTQQQSENRTYIRHVIAFGLHNDTKMLDIDGTRTSVIKVVERLLQLLDIHSAVHEHVKTPH